MSKLKKKEAFGLKHFIHKTLVLLLCSGTRMAKAFIITSRVRSKTVLGFIRNHHTPPSLPTSHERGAFNRVENHFPEFLWVENGVLNLERNVLFDSFIRRYTSRTGGLITDMIDVTPSIITLYRVSYVMRYPFYCILSDSYSR